MASPGHCLVRQTPQLLDRLIVMAWRYSPQRAALIGSRTATCARFISQGKAGGCSIAVQPPDALRRHGLEVDGWADG